MNEKKPNGKVRFPANILSPVAGFLRQRLAVLERRKKDLEREDPFTDPSRVLDNASPDTDAGEQFGHARIEAIRKELDRRIIQTRKALTRIKIGKYGICETCGEMIDTERLMVFPETTLCAKDAAKREK
jgi:RNA polymerase-binding transcription factor DksA